MKIQRSPLKNKTINTSKIRINPKLKTRFRNSSLKTSKTKQDNKNLNFIYMALNQTIKINSFVNRSINNYNNKETKTIYDKIILKGTNNNKSCILQNLYLANLLNMGKKNLNSNNSINSIIKNVNINKCFLENCKNSASNDDKKYINNNNKEKEKFYSSIDSAKRKKKIFSLMRIKSNMRYIKDNPFFNDLNLQPSSEKSWFFSCEKKNPINNRNNKNYENINKKKRIIPKINIKKNLNNSNLIFKSKNFNSFLLKDILKRGNDDNKKIINNYSNKSLYKTHIIKNDNIILGYKYKNTKSYKEPSINIIKNNNKTKISYETGYNKRKIKSKNCYKNNIFKLNSFRISKNNPIILIDNNGLNSLKSNEKKESDNDIDTNILNEDLIMSNISFSDDSKGNENRNILNPIYS